MNHIFAMTKRNILLFFRDRSAVFFSFLSSIIIVALYFLFIANLYKEGISSGSGGTYSDAAANFMVYMQMMAGVLVLNSMSLSLGAFETIAKDFEGDRVSTFLLTPLRVGELLGSYLLSGLFVSFCLDLLTWVVSAVLIGALTGYWISAATFFMAVLVVLVACVVSSAIMMLITAIVRSPAAVGVISGVAGTFFGFLCGIYIPYSSLGDGIVKVGSFIPFTHLTIWLKQTVLGDVFNQLGVPDVARSSMLKDAFSASDVGLCGIDLPLDAMVLFSAAFGIICFIIAWMMMVKRIGRRSA
jgi:multidrug/hemolysin transport system permease protein